MKWTIMSVEQQKTFGAVVGMDQVVPTTRHGDDLVECSDGAEVPHRDVCYDCRDNPHSNESDQRDADVAIVTEILEVEDKWITEYCTKNEDYADGYVHAVAEGCGNHNKCIEEWVDTSHFDYKGKLDFVSIDYLNENADSDGYDASNPFEDGIRLFNGSITAKNVALEMSGDFDDWAGDAELVYNSNEYASYTGRGCCFASVEVGEYENQLNITSCQELSKLHNQGRLDDVLDSVDCDAYVSRSKRRVKNEKTGRYEDVGRDTYDPYGSDYPDIMTYHMPDGQWHWVVSEGDMEQAYFDALCRLFKNWW